MQRWEGTRERDRSLSCISFINSADNEQHRNVARKLSVHTSPCLSSYAVSSVRWVTHQRQLFVSSPHSRLLFLLHGLFQCTYYTGRFERNHPYFRPWLETLLEIKSIGITLFFRFLWFFYYSTVLFNSIVGTVKNSWNFTNTLFICTEILITQGILIII